MSRYMDPWEGEQSCQPVLAPLALASAALCGDSNVLC